MRCLGGRSSAYVLVLKLVKSVCLSLSVCLSIYMCTYMNNHVHSPPQSKKEKNREERKKNHTPQKKPKFTLYLVLKKCLVFCYTSLSILPSFSPSSQDVLRSTPIPSLPPVSLSCPPYKFPQQGSLTPSQHPSHIVPASEPHVQCTWSSADYSIPWALECAVYMYLCVYWYAYYTATMP